jgi:hypothetical protein
MHILGLSFYLFQKCDFISFGIFGADIVENQYSLSSTLTKGGGT